ncbi:MAG: RimK family protein, partial [Rickettsiales bacterium]|nr:RimK family protein [Rickettsiales bacterium]
MSIITHLVIVDKVTEELPSEAPRYVISAQDYIANRLPPEVAEKTNLRVINLCNDYDYLKTGYYCSLLADAREHRCIPNVWDIVQARWKRVHKHAFPELERVLAEPDIMELSAEESAFLQEDLYFFFGRTADKQLRVFGRKLFDAFRLPIMRVRLRQKHGHWRIKEVEALTLNDIRDQMDAFRAAISQYMGSYWNKKGKPQDKYWLAVLHDPDEPLPPSTMRTLKKLVEVGRKKRFFVELITKRHFESLLEYDALFIRATTSVNHYTYRFAQKAEREEIPCVDDTNSILRCCNKIYLQELLKSKKIKTPFAYFINRRQKDGQMPTPSEYPVVLKVPDGSFSLGVFKVNSPEEFQQKVGELFKKSELLLVQEFLPSAFDWRIGLLGGKPLFACKYYMAKKHWQIYNHGSKRF